LKFKLARASNYGVKVDVITATSARFKHLSFAHDLTLALPNDGAATSLREPARLIKGLDLFRIGSGSGCSAAGKTQVLNLLFKRD